MVRAYQRDAFALAALREDLSEVVTSLFGGALGGRWTSEIATVTELLYLTLTTVRGQKTMGEEYCDLTLVSSAGHPLTLRHRAVLVLLHCLTPYCVARLRRVVARVNPPPDAHVLVRGACWLANLAVDGVLNADTLVLYLNRFHLAAFYLTGTLWCWCGGNAGRRRAAP